jgi:dihydroorotase-like cyclic amidohydrolase
MARVTPEEADWVEEFRKSRQTEAELEHMKRVLRKAAKLRERTNIAPWTTQELVRAVRDENDQN